MKKTIHIFLILFTANNFVNAQDGSLDLSFGTGGKITTAFGTLEDNGNGVVMQSDGKIIVVGSMNNGTEWRMAAARYNVDGTLDNTFNADGKLTMTLGSPYVYGNSVVMQTDGKILIAGETGYPPNCTLMLFRYHTSGILDATFNGGGYAVIAVGSIDSRGRSITVQGDGKVVAGGRSNNGSNYDFALVRFLTTGGPDNSFDGDGKLTTDFSGTDDYGESVVIQPDGKIIVAGYSKPGSNYDFALARYNTDGTLDNSFDFDGKVTTSITSSNDYGRSVVLQADGKIILTGYCNNGSNYDFALVRYNSDGSLDNTFDSDGIIITAMGGSHDYAYSAKILNDGKILLAGNSIISGQTQFSLAKYNSDGSLDISFDTDGKVILPLGGIVDLCYGMAIQSDGKIVLSGSVNNGTDYDFGLMRLNGSVASSINYENSETSSFNLFPNPTTGKINLELNQSLNNASIKIIDITGQTILSQQNLNGNYFTFDISNYSTGLYFLEVGENGSFERIKFVKE